VGVAAYADRGHGVFGGDVQCVFRSGLEAVLGAVVQWGGEMSMKYIRDRYKVPAKRGMIVCYDGYMGIITSASCYLRVTLTCRHPFPARFLLLHPTHNVAYLLPDGQWVYTDVKQRTLTACKIYSESMDY